MHERHLCHLWTTAIQDWPVPKSKKYVQSFLGLVNYYRRFIRNCSAIANPLTLITKYPVRMNWKCTKCLWSPQDQNCDGPSLQTFHSVYTTIVTTKASTVAIGAVLQQENPTERHLVAFKSRTLNYTEKNYAPQKLALLANVDTPRAWRPYL